MEVLYNINMCYRCNKKSKLVCSDRYPPFVLKVKNSTFASKNINKRVNKFVCNKVIKEQFYTSL